MSGGSRTMGGSDSLVIYTIGHSNHDVKKFTALLRGAGITAVADVRSTPFSRFTPQFNRSALKVVLAEAGIAYSFLGEELGARPKDRACYRDGTAVYELIAKTSFFQAGLERVLKGTQRYRIALMCTEKDPLDCHRNILVARHLGARGACIRHILANGRVEENAATELRLLKLTGQRMRDMFVHEAMGEPLTRAYEIRGATIAYTEVGAEQDESSPSHDERGTRQ
ncbi:MAG TPA: DUF488 domain-containing protein [Archangium sp.]|uniref:DUF488 domain-containing protein n=1 Tax=Archangium sp. TaxID=1872627 RepID=UPI002E36EB3D|nr:DUF488 domain-containing protein [Archangium sp.]HEX5753874.1 DUF488 domain-containing protein [Archangium sp.]